MPRIDAADSGPVAIPSEGNRVSATRHGLNESVRYGLGSHPEDARDALVEPVSRADGSSGADFSEGDPKGEGWLGLIGSTGRYDTGGIYCPVCHGERVVPVAGPDEFGNYDTDDCPECS